MNHPHLSPPPSRGRMKEGGKEVHMANEELLAGLKTALQTEMNGVEFYRLAAEKTGDPKGREVFKTLANDEAHHYIELKKHYEALLKTGKWLPKFDFGNPTDLSGASPIFSDDFKQRIKDRHFEMSALSIGALLETNSIDYYRQIKEKSGAPEIKKFFAELQQWEERHLDAIVRQIDLLKEEFWQNAHWAPY